MAYHEISDDFWNREEPLLEPFKRKKPGGSPPVEFRRILNAPDCPCMVGPAWSRAEFSLK